MDYIYEDKAGMRAMVHKTPGGFNLLLDNIHLGNPQTHTFASVLIRPEEREAFIRNLAKELEVEIGYAHVETPLPETVVEVHDYQEEFYPSDWSGPRYCVSGDVNDFLAADEAADLASKWVKLDLSNGSWSSNYFVQDLAQIAFDNQGFEFESEGMCFFAYTDDKPSAERLAAWINGKDFLK